MGDLKMDSIEDRIKKLEEDISTIKTILTFFVTRVNDKGEITNFSSYDGPRLLELLDSIDIKENLR